MHLLVSLGKVFSPNRKISATFVLENELKSKTEAREALFKRAVPCKPFQIDKLN